MTQFARLSKASGTPVSSEAEAKALNRASCVVRGTKMVTRQGEVAVENLTTQDHVVTRDHGLLQVRWVGKITVEGDAAQTLAPIKVPAGGLSRGVPVRDAYLAPNTRVWMQGAEFEAAFTAREVLVPVDQLAGWRGIRAVPVERVDYYLVLCDAPQVMIADGLQVEMAHPGALLSQFETLHADDMVALFPDLIALKAQTRANRRRLSQDEAAKVIDLRKRA